MKKSIKSICFVLLLISVISLMCLCTSAAEEITSDKSENDTDASYSENIFETAYNKTVENIGDISSFIGLAVSLVLMIGYKRNLLPILRGSIGVIEKRVNQIEAATHNGSDEISALSNLISSKLAAYELTLEGINDCVGSMEARTARAELESKGRAEIFSLMEIECELLYEIFMSSSLPQYEKERVGEHIGKMREMLGKPTNNI